MTDRTNMPFVKLNQTTLDVKNTLIHKNSFGYISRLITENTNNLSNMSIIKIVRSIGVTENDKMICLVNLFIAAIKYNKIQLMVSIMDYYKNNKMKQQFIVNAHNIDYPLIIQSAYHGNVEIVKFLLKYGASLNCINKYGENIFKATMEGFKDNILKNPNDLNLITNKYQEIFDTLKAYSVS